VKRFVPAGLHGLLDYMTVGLFLGGAQLFRLRDAPASVKPAQVFGTAICVLGPITDYGRDKPFGGARIIPMKHHLAMDAVFGLTIGLAPWVSGSWRKGWNYWAPQTFAMTSELFFALTTRTDD
jgi:hypothetical protein